MNGQTKSINVRSEAEGQLVIETPDGGQSAYYLCPNRTMSLDVDQLNVTDELIPSHFGDDNLGLARERPLFVRGTATLKGGSISVMGDPGSETRRLAIDFYALDDDVWRKHKELAQMLGKTPHYTDARVGLERHRPGAGTDGFWFVQCQVPPAMLRAMTNAVRCGAIASISIRLVLRGIYSRGADVLQSAPSGWFLRPNWRDNSVETPETAYGVITLLNFEETQTDSSPDVVHRPRRFGDTTPAPLEA